MLGRVAVVVLAVLYSFPPAFSQCNFTPVRSAQFRSSALDLSIDGNDLWVATSYGLSLYDRSLDPPRLIATIAVPGATRFVRARNGIAYAGSGTSLVVVAKAGAHSLQVAKTIETGGTINDLVLTTLDLYVASSTGIAQYEPFDLLNLRKTTATFPTSRPSVISLAAIDNTLYAADGDATIEAFSIPSGQFLGNVTAPSPVNYVRASNGKLYASSGALSTYVFSGTGASMTNLGTGAFGTVSVAPISGDVSFMAGTDRRLHAVDFTVLASPVDVFRADLPTTDGTVNRIAALATAGSRLYVAAGDIGLVTYDVTGFSSPFAIRAYSTGGGSSIVSLTDFVYIARDTGGITEYKQSSTGSLTFSRTWDATHADTLRDGANSLLLSSRGASLTMWTTQSNPPQPVTTATFRAPIVSAVLIGTNTAVAVLSDRTLWTADMAQATPAPKAITIAGFAPSAIARSGTATVVEDLRDDGTTALAYFTGTDFSTPAKTASVPGITATPVTLSGATAAVLTFQGITLVNFTTGASTVLPNSTGLARALVLNGTSLYELTATTLIVWDTQKQSIVTQYTIPADPLAIHAAPNATIVDVATTTGVATVATTSASKAPAAIAASNSNTYYKRVVTGADRIDLFDGRNADIYNTTLRYTNTLRGIADVAANDNGVSTISNALVASSYTADGVLRGSFTIAATGARALGIRAVGIAMWVPVESGCPACVQTTYVFDPRTGMAQTAKMDGGVIDVVASGNRAYVITDSPSEVRVVTIADPFHPSTIISIPAPQTAVSISAANGTVYVLGDKLGAYAESTLTPIADILGSYLADPTGVLTTADQRVRIDGNCAIVIGRVFSPQLFTIASAAVWTPAASFPVPSPVRSIATQPGVFQMLTDHSLETWSISPLPKPPRREPAR